MTDLLYSERVESGHAGYAPTDALVQAWQEGRASRVWKLGERVVSLQLKGEGRGIWKSRDRFLTLTPSADLDALAAVGVRHPSSWADCYHQLAQPMRPLPYTLNGLFNWWRGGPWSEARRIGEHRGAWHRYDLQSAYRWAARCGLPDPETYRVVTRWQPSESGLWLVTLQEERPDLPTVFRFPGRAVASTDEVDRYNLAVLWHRGVVWDKTLGADYVERTLCRLPDMGKTAGRAYWGRWIAHDPLRCWTEKAEWALRNLHAHFIWGWVIVGRVRLRVWEVSTLAAHVYVDEVLTPHPLPTGTADGDWRLKEFYPSGVFVRRTGWYGARDATRPTMQTGVSQ